jgi:hypothetical protein
MPSATSDTTGAARLRIAALLLAVVLGIATYSAAGDHRLAWLFGLGNTLLVYLVTVGVHRLIGERPGKQEDLRPETAAPDWPSALYTRALDEAEKIKLPEAEALVTVLGRHLRMIHHVERAGDHRLVKELRDEMEAAVILLEQGADKLPEKLQSMTDNLNRLQDEARGTLGS